MTLEPSIYVNGPEPPRRSRQIVLTGACRHQTSVVWSFIRFHEPPEDGAGEAGETAAPQPGAPDLFKG